MFDPNIFGQRLRQLRKKAGLTQAQVGKLLQITSTQVSDMEGGKTTTSLARLCILCDFYNVSADYLLGRSDEP